MLLPVENKLRYKSSKNFVTIEKVTRWINENLKILQIPQKFDSLHFVTYQFMNINSSLVNCIQTFLCKKTPLPALKKKHNSAVNKRKCYEYK